MQRISRISESLHDLNSPEHILSLKYAKFAPHFTDDLATRLGKKENTQTRGAIGP